MENNFKKPLAVVAGKAIYDSDVDEAIAAMGQRGAAYQQNPQGRAMILEQLIEQRLFLADAMRNVYEREPEFKAQMARIREQLLIQYAVNKAVAGAKVTDEEAKAFFDENPEQFVGQETVAASHILVDSEEKANEILGKIKAGEMTFEAAAAEFSSCPSSQNGGSLGEFGHGQMVPEFDQACFSMEVGAISEPVKTQFGYHIIRLDEKNEAKPIPYEDIAEQIKQHMLSEKQRQALQSKINQLKILFPVER